ncbi:MAG: M48 family metalloprotease [Chitinophagales bacterium]|nr:M48 family metalloprotease [Chitinophagales bacterium]
MNRSFFFIILLGIWGIQGCKKANLFTIQDDIALGRQTHEEILRNPGEYPILNESTNKAAYNYLYAMRDALLNSSNHFEHKNDFEWKIYIIDRDDVLNAFCTPGGYIYIYTGLIKYLDDASSLAGVLGHEMAHADRRHSTRQMTEIYGIQALLSFIGGSAQQIAEIAAQLIVLKFSRNHEKEADTYSVKYLCGTRYRADGAADFFKKIGSQGIPEFLSTHPDPGNRVANITKQKQELGCEDADNYQPGEDITSYNQLKAALN